MIVRFRPETAENCRTIWKENGCGIAKTDGSILVQMVRARIAKVPSLYLEKPVLQTFAEQVKWLVHVFILRNGKISIMATSMSIDSGSCECWQKTGIACWIATCKNALLFAFGAEDRFKPLKRIGLELTWGYLGVEWSARKLIGVGNSWKLEPGSGPGLKTWNISTMAKSATFKKYSRCQM